MPVHTSAVGTTLSSASRKITTRECLAYAAGIEDYSAALFDDLDPNFMACPQICVSLEWPLVSHADITAAYACEQDERGRGVHYIQDSMFHTPIRPEDEVKSDLQIIGVSEGRAGARTVLEATTKRSDGTPLVTSWTTSVLRGVAIEGEDTATASPAPWPDAGDYAPLSPVEIFIQPGLPHVYTECADIWNPIHTEREVALAAGLPDIILHGTATWALAVREVVADRLGGDPSRLARFTGRFTGMVIPGTDITVRHAATDKGAVYEVIAADGSKAISAGRALFRE